MEPTALTNWPTHWVLNTQTGYIGVTDKGPSQHEQALGPAITYTTDEACALWDAAKPAQCDTTPPVRGALTTQSDIAYSDVSTRVIAPNRKDRRRFQVLCKQFQKTKPKEYEEFQYARPRTR